MAEPSDSTASRVEWLLLAACLMLFMASVALMAFGIFPDSMAALISLAAFGTLAVAVRRRTRIQRASGSPREQQPVRDVVISLVVGGVIFGIVMLIVIR